MDAEVNLSKRQFDLCLDNKGYPASLELRKVYKATPDAVAAKRHLVRLSDESGEDYLNPDGCFVPIQLPKAACKAFPRG